MTNLGFLATSREWDELEPRWYLVNVCNESSKKVFQSEPGWPEFPLQAMILAEVTSTTIVLRILRRSY